MTMMRVMALVLVAVTVAAATVEARGFDAETMLGQMFKENGEANFEIKSTTTACCNKCLCTKSYPPQCHCRDIGETCHSACKNCICALSYPPQCRCTDTTTFCYPPCPPSAKSLIAAEA